MQMFGLMFLMVSYLASVRSRCFLPEEMPPFPVGLNTPAELSTTFMVTDEVDVEDEIELLRDWESMLEAHLVSYLNRETDLDEWTECYSVSITFNFADGPGSAMNIVL